MLAAFLSQLHAFSGSTCSPGGGGEGEGQSSHADEAHLFKERTSVTGMLGHDASQRITTGACTV